MKIETDFEEDKTARSRAYYSKHENVGITLSLSTLSSRTRGCVFTKMLGIRFTKC